MLANRTQAALVGAATLVNLSKAAQLTDVAVMDELVGIWGFEGDAFERGADEVLRDVRELSSELRAVWRLGEDGIVTLANELLLNSGGLPQLVRSDHVYRICVIPSTASLANQIAGEVGLALVDVVQSRELRRFGICKDPHCENVMVDCSRNRSKQFCSDSCANRAAVAAYRARGSQKARPPALATR